MTETTGRRVRIENRNPDGKKILSDARVTIDGEDISSHVLRADIHLDPRELPTAVIEVVDIDLDIEAELAVRETQPAPEAPTHELAASADPILCLGCLIDRHNGVREDVLPAMVILNGASVCADHFKIQDGPAPLPDRTPGGIILGGPINGGH
jgi:hypothetical protein